MPKIVQQMTRTIEDEYGNIKSKETQQTLNWGKEPNYIKLYLDNILYLKDLPSGLNTILLAFLKRMSYENQIVLNAGIKRMIAKETGVSMSSINNAITKFTKGDILKRIETGVYQVNPHLFGKGEWSDIAKIRLEVIFEPNGKSFNAIIERGTDKIDLKVTGTEGK